MPTLDVSIGKGIKETVSPYRVMPVWGEPLGSPYIFSWVGVPQVYNAGTQYTVKDLPDNVEAIVALAVLSGVPYGAYSIGFEWRNETEGIGLVWKYTYHEADVDGNVIAYSYISKTPSAISANGKYSVTVTVDEYPTLTEKVFIGIVGFPDTLPEPPVFTGDNFFDAIRWGFIDLTGILVKAAMWCYNIPIFEGLGDIFKKFSEYSSWIAAFFYDAAIWLETIETKIAAALDWSAFSTQLAQFLPGIFDVLDWFTIRVPAIQAQIDNWWSDITSTVVEWVNNAVNQAIGLIENFVSLEWLVKWWESWTPQIHSWIDGAVQNVYGVVDSWLNPIRQAVNANTAALETITDFINNPIKFIYDRFFSWFFGGE